MEDKSIGSLPSDVLLQIFSRIFETEIKQRKNITNIMQVNKQWNTLSSNYQMWEHILLNAGKQAWVENPIEREAAVKTAFINFLNKTVYVTNFPRTIKKILHLFGKYIDQEIFQETLFNAVKNNNFELVKLLCEQSDLKKLIDEKWYINCVAEAANNSPCVNKIKIIKYLIGLSKAILNFPNFEKSIAFFSVTRLHNELIAQVVLENISPEILASVDEVGNTLLIYSVHENFNEVVDYLLITLYLNADRIESFSLSKYILTQNNEGSTALHYTVSSLLDTKFFSLLSYIDSSIAVTVKDNEKNTLLHTLLKANNTIFETSAANRLLNYLIDTMPPEILNARNINGDTALHLAVREHPFFVANLVNCNKLDKLLYNKEGKRPDQQLFGVQLLKEVESFLKLIPKNKKEVLENILRQINAIDPKSESVIADLTGMYNAVWNEQLVLCHEDGGMKMFSSQGKTNTWKTCVNALKAKAIEIAKQSAIVKDKMDEPEVRILFDSILGLKTSRLIETDERSFQESFDNLKENKPK